MRFVRTNSFTGTQIVWNAAHVGARAVEENGRKPNGPGAPMLTMEANTFIDMGLRCVRSTRDVGVHYTIEE